MKGIKQAPAGLMTWAMGRLLPKLVDFLKHVQNLQTTSMKKELLESLERQLRRMDAIQFKMSQEKQQVQQVDPHDSHCWAIDAWKLSYDMEDTIDNLLLLCVVQDVSEPKDDDSVMEMLEDIKARLKNLAAASNSRVAGDFVAMTSSSTTATVVDDPCIEDGFKEVRHLVGIHELTAEITTMMSSSSHELQTVSIWGAGGMGKTTLAKAVYDSIKREFQCGAFVSLGLQNDMKKTLRDILTDLGKGRYMDLNMTRLDERQLIDELRHFLKNKRFLIAIDDIRDMQSWKKIECALIDSGFGSRIITTTRILDIAEASGEVLKLMPLSIDGSKELFYSTICDRKGTITADSLDEQFTECMLKGCGGVPLAIITIASLLAGKSQEEWTGVYNSIGFGQEDNNVGANNTRKIIQFSYYDIPSHLKTCLLYLSIFPEGHVIEKDTLVWRWVAEGFVHGEQEESLFKAGERYLHELISRSMIQPVENEDTNTFGCRIENMMLDLTRLVAKESFVTIWGWDDHGQLQSYPNNAHHTIAVHDNRVLEKTDLNLNKMWKPKVRSFNVTGCAISSMVSLLSSFQALRVLSLEDCRLTEEGSDDLKNLVGLLHLRYLGIRGMHIRDLPMEIGDLRYLQTLDLAARIRALPHSVTQLRQLKCLRCCGPSGLELPEGMGNLTSLEELQLGIVDNTPNFAEELRKLTELRTLRISISRAKCQEYLMESLSKLQKIKQLELLHDGLGNGDPCCNVIGPGAFPKLRHLRMDAWPMYQPGAMPYLKSVELGVNVRAFKDANFDLQQYFYKLRYLRLVEKVHVRIICQKAKMVEAQEAEAALRRVVESHTNRPNLILTRFGRCVDDDEKILLFGWLHGSQLAPRAMPLEKLRQITDDFSEKQKLGSGTFGTVYKGVLYGKEVAVKLLHSMSQRLDYEKDFMKEFENLSRLNHPNIVQLLGYCYEIKRICVEYEGKYVLADQIDRALCFDYMHNGSLQQHLDDESHGLEWSTPIKLLRELVRV